MKNILKAILPSKSEPSLGEQYGAALALKGAALSVFDGVLDDLVQAEAELVELASQAAIRKDAAVDAHTDRMTVLELEHQLHVAGLDELSTMAYEDASHAFHKAEKIRDLIA